MSKTSPGKFSSEFKSKVCIKAIKEQQTIEVLCKNYELHPTQINNWNKEFLTNSAVVFKKESGTNVHDEKSNLFKRCMLKSGN